MKRDLRVVFVAGLAVASTIATVHGQEEKETLGDKIKKLFTRPTLTATPTPRKPHRAVAPLPSATISSGRDSSALPFYGETPAPSVTPGASTETLLPSERTPETQNFEPVRPINPGPQGRISPRVIYSPPPIPAATEMASPSATPEVVEEKSPEERPIPSLPPVTGSPAAEISVPSEADILESKDYADDVRKLVETSLDLAKKNLNYKYASADPANGGLDCSGFIYYVLTKSGIKSVPRDAREQYVWVRKAGNFQAVLGHADDSFELDSLRPGDLLFWANNSGVSRQPEISQITIYLGREKVTNQRLMAGATEASTYKGEKRSGVGVFDFKLGAVGQNDEEEPPTSVFVGYGRFPDLSGN